MSHFISTYFFGPDSRSVVHSIPVHVPVIPDHSMAIQSVSDRARLESLDNI